MPIQNGQKPVYNIIAPIKISLFEEKVAVFQKNRRCLMYLRGIETAFGFGANLSFKACLMYLRGIETLFSNFSIDFSNSCLMYLRGIETLSIRLYYGLNHRVPNVPKRNREWLTFLIVESAYECSLLFTLAFQFFYLAAFLCDILIWIRERR